MQDQRELLDNPEALQRFAAKFLLKHKFTQIMVIYFFQMF